MRFDYGYDEEKHLGNAYDIKLFKKILPFAGAHRAKLALSVFMVVVITLLELSVPYITKEIIDTHILPQNRLVDRPATANADGQRSLIVALHDPAIARIVHSRPDLFQIREDTATIRLSDLDRLDIETLQRLRHRDFSGLFRFAGLFIAVVVTIFVFTFFQNLIMETTGHRIMHDLRIDLYRHIQAMPLGFFSRNPVARLVTRVTNDIQNMHELFTSFISMVFKDIFLLIGIAVVLMAMDWGLALLAFLVLPLVVVAAFGFSKRVRDVFRELRVKVAQINTRFSETIAGIKVIQIFRKENENYDAFARLNHENYLAGMRQINIFAVFMPIIEMLGVTAIAIVIFVGGSHVLEETISIGVLAAFLSYMKMFFRPIRDLAEKYNILQNALASAERIFLLMEQPTADAATREGKEIEGPLKDIHFDKVSLAYTKNRRVLRNIDLRIKAGETVAIVGATGSGKTSLVNLLVRFYDPTEGVIKINGFDTTTLLPETLRKRFALVMQDPFLFTGTLESNIFFAAPNVSQMQKERILERSRCKAMIERLPEGTDTVISEGGTSLSSGERQLISVARAFATNPEVIILDEATSYVDSETEVYLQQAIGNLMHGRTSLVVAHRLTTARHADRIVVLNNGKLAETGSHDTLMSKKGYYYRLYELHGNQAHHSNFKSAVDQNHKA
jgi:ATP-binding cassette subfamily B multidrug efflux pump